MASAKSIRQKAPAPDFGGQGAYRRMLEPAGRVHIDRPLPFLVLNRHPDVAFSVAQRVAVISPSSVVWPDSPEADASAIASIHAVIEHQRRDFPKFLLVSLYDLPLDASLDEDSPRLEEFRLTLSATADPPAQAAAQRLRAALADICIEQRQPTVESVDDAYAEPGIEPLAKHIDGLSRLSLGLPQIYRVPSEERIYPQILHELETTVFDALLQCFAAFVEVTTPDAAGPTGKRHHRSLGRSSFIKAALTADQALDRISRSFDFLLGISPINTVRAFERFQSDKCQSEPVFRYRPLTVSPEMSKRDLYAIDLRAVEDPVLESLFREKQLELDQQLMMLQRRNTPAFRHISMLQYGGVETPLLAQAHAILRHIDRVEDGGPGTPMIGGHAVLVAAEALLARYRHKVPEFKAAKACLREDLGPGLMVSGESLLISTATRMSRARLDALLQHEISVHLLTCINGNQQGLGIFGAGLAGYEGIQEGLGVFAEFVVDGLTPARLRLLAARVLVVDAMLDGATFIDCHRLLCDDHGFSSRGAFNIVARVFRSGGLTKDAIYLRGLNQVFDFVASGRDLDPFWFGKIAEQHVPVVEELRTRGILRNPVATPEFLARPGARRNIERIRSGASFIDLLRKPAPC